MQVSNLRLPTRPTTRPRRVTLISLFGCQPLIPREKRARKPAKLAAIGQPLFCDEIIF